MLVGDKWDNLNLMYPKLVDLIFPIHYLPSSAQDSFRCEVIPYSLAALLISAATKLNCV